MQQNYAKLKKSIKKVKKTLDTQFISGKIRV
jgi:hypothetical protein